MSMFRLSSYVAPTLQIESKYDISRISHTRVKVLHVSVTNIDTCSFETVNVNIVNNCYHYARSRDQTLNLLITPHLKSHTQLPNQHYVPFTDTHNYKTKFSHE
jgi:hypothetical protein